MAFFGSMHWRRVNSGLHEVYCCRRRNDAPFWGDDVSGIQIQSAWSCARERSIVERLGETLGLFPGRRGDVSFPVGLMAVAGLSKGF